MQPQLSNYLKGQNCTMRKQKKFQKDEFRIAKMLRKIYQAKRRSRAALHESLMFYTHDLQLNESLLKAFNYYLVKTKNPAQYEATLEMRLEKGAVWERRRYFK